MTGAGRHAGVDAPEFTQWFEGLSHETRTMLEGRPDLRRLFAEMDPMTRRVLTRCRSSCIPAGASATDVARIEGLLRRLGLGAGDEAAIEILRDYFHERADRLERAITDVEHATTIDDLRARAALASLREGLVPARATAADVARIEQIINSVRGLGNNELILLHEFFNLRANSLTPAIDHLIGAGNERLGSLRINELRARLQQAAATRSGLPAGATMPVRNPAIDPATGAVMPGQYDTPSGAPYRHTRREHGPNIDPVDMMRAARDKGVEQGQWYSDALWAEAMSRADSSTFLEVNAGRSIYEFDMGRPIGRIFDTNGIAVSDVRRVRVVRNADGSLRTLFPIR